MHNLNPITRRRGAACLWLGLALLNPLAHADSVRVEGPPQAGHARPPLHINVTPSLSYAYTPAQIRHAYGFDKIAGNGAGQKIAIVDAYGNASIQSDLDTFCAQYGIPSTTVQILGSNTSVSSGWAMETALDVEWAHAIAPGATLILSVGKSNSILDLLSAVDAAVSAGATVISMSWGATDFSSESSYDGHFNRAGVTFTASSGDSGSGVEWPAASPYVIGVGGTSLVLDSNNNRSSEVAWSGSGGGSSAYEPRPTYQVGWHGYSGRGVPDVSYVADPNTGMHVYDSVNGGWLIVGGTSAGAPQWAALIALVNQTRGSAVGAVNPTLYSLAKNSSTTPYTINPTYFFDVSQGNNGGFTAGAQYDFVTGLGSPVANNLTAAFGGATISPDFSLAVTPSSQSVTAGSGTTYNVGVSGVGGFSSSVALSVSGLPSGASASFSPASILPSASSQLSVSTLSSTPAGTYTLTITGSGGLTHTTTATLVVSAAVVTTPDFTMSASPISATVKRGGSTAFTVSVSGSGGFSSTVALAGVTSGFSYAFSPASITGSGSSQLTLTAASNFAKGNYTVTIKGTSSTGKIHTTSVTVKVVGQ